MVRPLFRTLFSLILAFAFSTIAHASGPMAPESLIESCEDRLSTTREPEVILQEMSSFFQAYEFDKSFGYQDGLRVQKLIHQFIISLIDRPTELQNLKPYKQKIKRLIEQRPISMGGSVNMISFTLQNLNELLELFKADAEDWIPFLIHDSSSIVSNKHNSYSTAGYILQSLPEAKAKSLVQKLGQEYARQKDRSLTQPIHAILNPRQLYLKMKAEQRSDREFYDTYIDLVKSQAFANTPIGGHSTDLIFQIVQEMQNYLRTRKDLTALNFFGSIPNGFARSNSDYDVFNHVEGEDEERNQMHRYQINDPKLQKRLQAITNETDWNWHLEDHGERAHEHFAAIGHVFSFHITKKKISLRFYPNYIRTDRNSNEREAFDYIELSI